MTYQAPLGIVKGALLDGIGVAIAGTETEVARNMVQWARETGRNPSAGIIARRLREFSHNGGAH